MGCHCATVVGPDQLFLLGVHTDHRVPGRQVSGRVLVGRRTGRRDRSAAHPRWSWHWPADCSPAHAAIDASPMAVTWWPCSRNAGSGPDRLDVHRNGTIGSRLVSGSINDSGEVTGHGSCSSARFVHHRTDASALHRDQSGIGIGHPRPPCRRDSGRPATTAAHPAPTRPPPRPATTDAGTPTKTDASLHTVAPTCQPNPP